MTFKIQRVPLGLQSVLATSGGETPRELAKEIRGCVDVLQLYGLTQLQSNQANAAALAEGTNVTLTLSQTAWTIVYCLQGSIIKTATMTALRASVSLNRRSGASPNVFSEELGPFGANETGLVAFGGYLPYPVVCPPGTTAQLFLQILGTDATCNATILAEFGVLG